MNERLIVAAMLLAVPLGLLAVARGAEFSDLAAFSPMFFPTLVLQVWAVVAGLSFVLEVARLRAADGGAGDARETATRSTIVRIALVIVAMAAFVMLMTEIGFVLAGTAFAIAVLLVLGIRSGPLIVVYGIGVPLGLFVLFNHALGLPLPTSPFTYLF